MAGHSKFKNIMHRKGSQDKKRAKIFSRLGREIVVAVREGGFDIDNNVRLRSVVSTAKALNMPKDNIQRAIKKGEGNSPDLNYEEVRYEGYGPSGVAVIIETLTNNKNRTAAEIRSTFSKYGGNLGESGSVSYNFKRLGTIIIEKQLAEENDIFEFVAENGSEDLEISDNEYTIYCEPSILHSLNEKIINKYGKTLSSQLTWKSDTNIEVQNDNLEKLFQLFNSLEENEDVQSVSSNFEVNDEILTALT